MKFSELQNRDVTLLSALKKLGPRLSVEKLIRSIPCSLIAIRQFISVRRRSFKTELTSKVLE
jgi:hypothetical protein